MASLLHAIFAGLLEGEFIELRMFSPDKQQVRRMFFTDVDELLRVVQENRGRYNCYFGVAPRASQNGDKAAVSRLLALWTESDCKDYGGDMELARDALDRFPLPPSFVVNSGHGYHAYWLLQEPCSPAEGEQVMRGIREVIGAQDSVWDCARILRVPGSLNFKSDPPVPCEVVEERPVRYLVSDLQGLLRVREETRTAILTNSLPRLAARGKTDRSTTNYAIIDDLLKAGVSKDAVRAIFDEARYQVGDKHRERPEDYLERTLSKFGSDLGPKVSKAYFMEADDCYLNSSDQTLLSTFVFHPRRLLRGPTEDVFLGTIRSGGREWKDVPIPKSAFSRTDSFLRHLTRVQWQWLGSDRQVRQLLPYLVGRWQEAGAVVVQGTDMVGRFTVDGVDYWVADGKVLTVDSELDNDHAPIVYIPTGRPYPKQVLIKPDRDELVRTLERLAVELPKINRPEVFWPMLGWFMAAPVKPLLQHLPDPVRFPHLNAYGTKGSGKTSTILGLFMPMLGVVGGRSHSCATTDFVLLSVMACTNAVPVNLTEYRKSTMTEHQYAHLIRVLLTGYDYAQDHRGRANQTTQSYPLTAPVVLDGEDVIEDGAVRERSIFCNFSPETIAVGTSCRRAYRSLMGWTGEEFNEDAYDEGRRVKFHLVAQPYLQYTLSHTVDSIGKLWRACYSEVCTTFSRNLANRIPRNLATVLMGIRLWEDFLASYGVHVERVSATVLSECLSEVHDREKDRAPVLADAFIEEMVNSLLLTDTPQFTFRYLPAERVLRFHLESALRWWQRDRRQRGMPVIEGRSLKAQLREMFITPERKDSSGFYIHEPKTISLRSGVTFHMYGVDLPLARKAGLNVPESLDLLSVTIYVHRENARTTDAVDEDQ